MIRSHLFQFAAICALALTTVAASANAQVPAPPGTTPELLAQYAECVGRDSGTCDRFVMDAAYFGITPAVDAWVADALQDRCSRGGCAECADLAAWQPTAANALHAMEICAKACVAGAPDACVLGGTALRRVGDGTNDAKASELYADACAISLADRNNDGEELSNHCRALVGAYAAGHAGTTAGKAYEIIARKCAIEKEPDWPIDACRAEEKRLAMLAEAKACTGGSAEACAKRATFSLWDEIEVAPWQDRACALGDGEVCVVIATGLRVDSP